MNTDEYSEVLAKLKARVDPEDPDAISTTTVYELQSYCLSAIELAERAVENVALQEKTIANLRSGLVRLDPDSDLATQAKRISEAYFTDTVQAHAAHLEKREEYVARIEQRVLRAEERAGRAERALAEIRQAAKMKAN